MGGSTPSAATEAAQLAEFLLNVVVQLAGQAAPWTASARGTAGPTASATAVGFHVAAACLRVLAKTLAGTELLPGLATLAHAYPRLAQAYWSHVARLCRGYGLVERAGAPTRLARTR